MEKILRYAIPFIILLVAGFVFSVMIFGISFSSILGDRSDMIEGAEAIAQMPAMMYGTCALIYLLMWLKDREQTGFEGNEMPIKMWLILPVLGLAMAAAEMYALRGMMRQELSEAIFGISPLVMDTLTSYLPILFIGTFIIMPICNELLFRGLLQMRLREDMGKWSAILVVAIVSFVLKRSVDTVIFAVIFSFVYEYYRSLGASILVILSYELGIFIFFKMGDSVPGLGGEMSIIVPIILLLSVVACGFFLLMIYRKHNSPY